MENLSDMKTFLLLTGCSLIVACSSTRITSTQHAGYRMHEHLVITPLAEFSEVENDRLMTRATGILLEELIFLKIVPYQDALYKTRQLGLALPTYNQYDTAQLGMLHRKAAIQYVLTGDLISVKSDDFDKNSPYYKKTEATLNFQLLDAIHKTIIWRCTVQFTTKPLSNDNDAVNLRSKDYTLHKAYHKAIKRMTKNFELLPNRPQ